MSAVCRSVINQTVTPDALRGRMSSVFSLVVTSGPRLGDVEAGAVASLTSPRFSVAVGRARLRRRAPGSSSLAFPALARYDKDEAIAAMARLEGPSELAAEPDREQAEREARRDVQRGGARGGRWRRGGGCRTSRC